MNEILAKLNDKQEIQDAIIGKVLDYITAWSKPPKTDEKLYKLYTEFNLSKV